MAVVEPGPGYYRLIELLESKKLEIYIPEPELRELYGDFNIQGQLREDGIDLRLYHVFRRLSDGKLIDSYRDNAGVIHIPPFTAIRVLTLEAVKLPIQYRGLLFIRSSLESRGLIIGNAKIDPGFHGILRKTLINMGGEHISLKPGDRFMNLALFPIEGARAYGELKKTSGWDVLDRNRLLE